MKRDRRVTAYVSRDLEIRLHRTAYAHEQTTSDLIRDALRLWLSRLEESYVEVPQQDGQIEMVYNGPAA
jgi:Arc/MetJ-type ribon-helix-helix transcriptional regulator